MDDKIPTGAYIIQNKHHFKVLHVKTIEVKSSEVILYGRDENGERNHQIWWIEPLPLDEDSGEYLITNMCTGQALGVLTGPWNRIGKQLIVNKPHGGPGQGWRIQRFLEDNEG